MGLEELKEEILSEAKEQASSLISEARRESNRILKETEGKVGLIKEKSEQDAKKILDAIKRQELASAELENKKMALEAKKQIIDNVFADARKKLEILDDKKRESFIKKLLDKTKGDIEIAYVYCSKKDAKFLKGFSVEPSDIIGGLIAENKDKTIRVDYSYETILQSIKENELQNISKILFT